MNPILPLQHFVPDVEARQWQDGRVYLYGSYDISGGTEYCSHVYHVFSSHNMIDWVDHGVSFKSSGPDSDVPWSTRLIFAPDCVYSKGLYHLFFCMEDNTEAFATSKSPYGPFKNATPIKGAHGDAIDPAALVDDDGRAYLYWGQFRARAARLTPDFAAIEPESLQKDLITEAGQGFHEGASVRKRNGIYYLVYTDISRGKATCLAYATSRSPLGPFQKGGIIIDNTGCDAGTWNNHGSIAEFNGKWYVFYHRSSQGGSYSRRVCVEPIKFNDDGSIDEVEMTTQGISAPIPVGVEIEASRACLLSGRVRTEAVEPGPGSDVHTEHLAIVRNGDWAAYKYIDFSGGAAKFNAMVAGIECEGEMEVRLDGPDGRLIGCCHVPDTGGWHRWNHVSCSIESTIGIHAVYLVFKGHTGRLFNLKIFSFSK